VWWNGEEQDKLGLERIGIFRTHKSREVEWDWKNFPDALVQR